MMYDIAENRTVPYPVVCQKHKFRMHGDKQRQVKMRLMVAYDQCRSVEILIRRVFICCSGSGIITGCKFASPSYHFVETKFFPVGILPFKEIYGCERGEDRSRHKREEGESVD